MAKEIIKHRREDRKKPTLSLKERRAKKHEKKEQKKWIITEDNEAL